MEGDGVKKNEVTDTERLDWLQSQCSRWMYIYTPDEHVQVIGALGISRHNLREAIDEAMKGVENEDTSDV